MAISDPILDPLTIVIDADQEVPAPIQVVVTDEAFPRVKITATGIYVGSGVVAPTRVATLADKRTAYTQTYSTPDKTVAAPTAVTVATTAATQTTPYGFASQAQADAIVTAVNALIADDLDNRKTVTAIIDDLQALNFVG